VRICSYFVSSDIATQCLPFLYDPSNPESPVNSFGVQLTCDGSPHAAVTDVTGEQYACLCGGNLDPSVVTVDAIYQPVDWGPPIITNCTTQTSQDVLVEVNTALKVVVNSKIDLKPVIDLVQ
jgi:hypothetical protein